MRFAILACFVVLALCATEASRVPDFHHIYRYVKHRENEPALVACKFEVKPCKREAFLKAFERLEKNTQKEKGVILFELKRPINNNLDFVVYSEWETKRDFLDHFECRHTQEFLEEIAEANIPFKEEFLERPDVTEVVPDQERINRRRRRELEDDDMAHLFVHYKVPPAKTKEFEEAWDRAAKKVEGERGSVAFKLRKCATSNTEYMACGTWESLEDLKDHFESGHISELKETLDDHDILWEFVPVKKIVEFRRS